MMITPQKLNRAPFDSIDSQNLTTGRTNVNRNRPTIETRSFSSTKAGRTKESNAAFAKSSNPIKYYLRLNFFPGFQQCRFELVISGQPSLKLTRQRALELSINAGRPTRRLIGKTWRRRRRRRVTALRNRDKLSQTDVLIVGPAYICCGQYLRRTLHCRLSIERLFRRLDTVTRALRKLQLATIIQGQQTLFATVIIHCIICLLRRICNLSDDQKLR